MNDLYRLELLRKVLADSSANTTLSYLKLAADIESLVFPLEGLPENFTAAYTTLWDTLEIVGVKRHEDGIEPTADETADILTFRSTFSQEVDLEIERRSRLRSDA